MKLLEEIDGKKDQILKVLNSNMTKLELEEQEANDYDEKCECDNQSISSLQCDLVMGLSPSKNNKSVVYKDPSEVYKFLRYMSQLSKDNSGRALKASKMRNLHDYIDGKIKKYYPDQKDTLEFRRKLLF